MSCVLIMKLVSFAGLSSEDCFYLPHPTWQRTCGCKAKCSPWSLWSHVVNHFLLLPSKILLFLKHGPSNSTTHYHALLLSPAILLSFLRHWWLSLKITVILFTPSTLPSLVLLYSTTMSAFLTTSTPMPWSPSNPVLLSPLLPQFSMPPHFSHPLHGHTLDLVIANNCIACGICCQTSDLIFAAKLTL